jgi:ligand-binding sensor domain-containing protein
MITCARIAFEQFITDIVDGVNNKWIGTADSGVLWFHQTGKKQSIILLKVNSLPSNVINDIDINSTTGEVYIATAKGLVSFKGMATQAMMT